MTPHDMTDEQLEVLIWNMLHPGAEATVESRAAAIEICLWDGYYTTDLNACQEMDAYGEKIFADAGRTYWAHWAPIMRDILKRDNPDMGIMTIPAVLRATARQRCEAFVEVMEGR